jgi:hypothetical protein
MSEQHYFTLLDRIESRLSKPTLLHGHAVIFGVVSTVLGMATAATSIYGLIDSYVYVGVMGWCFLLSAHAAWTYFRSGAWQDKRESVIRETLLNYADDYEQSADEMVDLHERLNQEIQQGALRTKLVTGAIAGSVGLWFGMFALALLLSSTQSLEGGTLFVILQGIPMLGTLLLTLVLALSPFFMRRGQNSDALREARLRSIYGEKAAKHKRKFSERLAIDDEGELILPEDAPLKAKTDG